MKKSFLIILAVVLSACFEETVEGGEVIVRNDILDKQYNSFVVDQVVTQSGLAGFRRDLKPGNEIVIPYKGIKRLRFTRRYSDHSKVYVVACPPDFDKRVKMKLIDVHTNRLGGGCDLVQKGQIRGGMLAWEE